MMPCPAINTGTTNPKKPAFITSYGPEYALSGINLNCSRACKNKNIWLWLPSMRHSIAEKCIATAATINVQPNTRSVGLACSLRAAFFLTCGPLCDTPWNLFAARLGSANAVLSQKPRNQ